jgi:hypothetical protein
MAIAIVMSMDMDTVVARLLPLQLQVVLVDDHLLLHHLPQAHHHQLLQVRLLRVLVLVDQVVVEQAQYEERVLLQDLEPVVQMSQHMLL